MSYLVGLKGGISYIASHKYAKLKIDVDHDLPEEKVLTLHDVVIFTKPVLNKNHGKCYYKSFLEIFLYLLAKK